MLYLDRFYHFTHEAVDRNAFADLVYGCFIGCMYAIRADRPFKEIENHAKAFRLSVYSLTAESALGGEEMFLLECMWEKLLWYITKKLLFRPSSTVEFDLSYWTDYAQTLFLSELKDQPTWIQESYAELKLKIQFIRLVLYFYHYNLRDSLKVKESLFNRFHRDFMTIAGTRFNSATLISAQLRSLSRKLWTMLLALVLEVAIGTVIQSSSVSETMMENFLSIHFIIDLIPEPNNNDCLSIELRNLSDLAIYCLALIGLSMSELQHIDSFGLDLHWRTLTYLVFELTRARLVTWLRCSRNDETIFMSSFDQFCLELSLGTQAPLSVETTRVFSKWTSLCG